jgi:hypothetical protein
MATPLRAFLMLPLATGDWDIKVSQTLEDLVRDWEGRPDSTDGAVLHIGYERRPARIYQEAAKAFPGKLLLTQGAKAALPLPYRSSDSSVARSADQDPLYLALEGWGYVADAPAQRPLVADDSSWDGWVASFVEIHPDARDELSAAGINDDDSYLECEQTLAPELRRALGVFRAETLLERNWDSPCRTARVAPPWLRSMALADLPLTVRISNVFQQIGYTAVSDIAELSISELLHLPNFGRTSVHDLAGILRQVIEAGPAGIEGSAPREVAPTLLVAVRQSLLRLDDRSRDIVSRRMGLDGPPETLEQVARTYGVTRERIRQLESKAVKRIVRLEYWDDLLASKLKELLACREFPLPLIGVEAVDPWFEGLGKNPRGAKYILNNLCATSVGLITIGGVEYLSHIDQGRWDGTVYSARNLLKHAEGEQWTRRHARMMIEGLLPLEASELRSILWSEVEGRCHFGGEAEDAVLLRYGSGADQVVEAVLFESDEPLHFTEIARRASERARRKIDERRAHNAAAEIGYLFGPGTYGLLKHVLLSAEQLVAIAEEAAEIVEEGEQGKQWHASELLDELKRRGVVDNQVDKYVVDIALHEQRQLKPLGRLVWVAQGGTSDAARIEIRQALITILQQAGQPLSSAELRQRLVAVRGINSTMQFAAVDPLIKLDASMWGLNDRDLSVKRHEQPGFLDGVVGELNRQGRPIHISEAKNVFSGDIPARALFCIAANDPRLYIGMDRRLHLRSWVQ